MADVSDRDLQELQVLAALRQKGSTGRAAVRLDDLNGLLQIAASLQSAVAAGSTPTKAEFDKLVADVKMIYQQLTVVVAALRARQGR